MSRPAPYLRLFVSVHPPERSARAMLELLPELRLPPHRPVPLHQVHLTLQFVGDRPVHDVESVCDAVRESVADLPAFSLAPCRVETFPERGPARLVAVSTDAPPTLLELKRRLATRLARAPRRRPSDRFRPHLTVARLRTPTREIRFDRPVALEPFTVDRVSLQRSTLRSEGAVHAEVLGVSLGLLE